ncbi:MAG TPA: signal peptidase II [Actinomycetota bacterium]
MTPTGRSAAWLYGAAAGAYLLDRLTKVWVEQTLAGRPPIRLIPGVLSLTYTTNSGGAFGLGRSAPWLFATATLGVALIVVAVSFRPRSAVSAVALGLILGGGLGNLTDRALNGDGFLSGRVTDFIDFHVWPVFNLADSAIVVGAVLLVIATARQEAGGRAEGG